VPGQDLCLFVTDFLLQYVSLSLVSTYSRGGTRAQIFGNTILKQWMPFSNLLANTPFALSGQSEKDQKGIHSERVMGQPVQLAQEMADQKVIRS